MPIPELSLTTAHPDDRERLFQMVSTGDPTPATIRYLHREGGVVWAEVKLNPFYGGSTKREPVGVDGVVREIPNPSVDATKSVRIAGSLRIDLLDRHVTVNGQRVQLTAAEFTLLQLLSERPGQTVTREEMMRRLWRSAHVGDGHTCEAHISNLRKKIEADPRRPTRILTVRGQGYRLAD